jgi:hypothetical protein
MFQSRNAEAIIYFTLLGVAFVSLLVIVSVTLFVQWRRRSGADD